METVIDILINIGTGMLGLFLFALFAAKKYLKPSVIKQFKPIEFFKGIKWIAIWVFLMLATLSIILNLVPESEIAIKGLTALDIANNPAGFLTLGIGLSALTKEGNNK